MRITIPQVVHLDSKAIEEVFMHHLRELTGGWYLGESADPRQNGAVVLCRDTRPHPHSGKIFREEERALTDPEFEIQMKAAALLRSLLLQRG